MPQLTDHTISLFRLGHGAQTHVRRAWEGFVNFAARDNVLEVALGLIPSLHQGCHLLRLGHHPPHHLAPPLPQPQHGPEVRRANGWTAVRRGRGVQHADAGAR